MARAPAAFTKSDVQRAVAGAGAGAIAAGLTVETVQAEIDQDKITVTTSIKQSEPVTAPDAGGAGWEDL